MPLWTPARLNNVITWYSTAALTGSDYSHVSSLSDLSGNGRTISVNNNSPRLRTAAGQLLNGMPVLEFEGGSGLIQQLILDLGSQLPVNGLFMAVVYRTTSARINARLFEASGRSTHSQQTVGFSQGVVQFSSVVESWRVGIQGRAATIATRYIIIGNDLVHVGFSPWEVTVPPWPTIPNFCPHGQMAEWLLTQYQSTDNRQLIEGYLHWQWGLQAQLANDHPYKNAAPTYGETRRRRYAGAYGL